MYRHDKQYRCTIIRGKAKSEVDDLLPIYGKIVAGICPVAENNFPEKFNSKLSRFLPQATEKTINNHRTEIVTKLFGMIFSEEGMTFISQRTSFIVESQDHPAFFKDICFKLQFPNGMESPKTIRQRMNDEIRLRPAVMVLKCLKDAESKGLALSIDEVGYYILNNFDVLRGKATVQEVLKQIKIDRKNKVERIVHTPGKPSSYSKQHIRELINYLELANLITVEDRHLYLNKEENAAIKVFTEEPADELLFPIYDYPNRETEELAKIQLDWQVHYGKIAHALNKVFETDTTSLGDINLETSAFGGGGDMTVLGNDGEKLVYKYEKERINNYNPRYADRVRLVGGTKGIGYDVHSIKGEGSDANHAIYIEVKSTKRVTAPQRISDNVTVTRNEWLTAEQQGDAYWVYRVYFTKEGTFLFKLMGPASQDSENTFCEPITYRLDFEGNISDLEKVG